jgi:transcription antitermination factor NusG
MAAKRAGRTVNRRKQMEQGARRTNRKARANMGDRSYTWYVVFVMSQKEYIAQKILTAWGASVCLPLVRKLCTVNRFATKKKQRKHLATAAVPGVLLLGVRGEMDWYDLSKLRVVYSVLGVNGAPVEMDGVRLRRYLADNHEEFGLSRESNSETAPDVFTTGDRAQIAAGPLKGQLIDIKDIQGDQAYFISQLFGGEQEIKITLDKLQKAA